ncbi:Nuclear RNA export factor 2 [Tupaia chinensis]|uniref:Nuclear RNA export factor 2 n=1 Tax=Tupaia chinensis TaxID=246437 RepID=L8Y592_TUPCH|nr:Nuclear RNA export factor 2 [Tupaia chinensis]
MRQKTQDNCGDRTIGSWFKVTIPCGRKYNKTWLMSSIQSQCSVSFTPVDFHYVRNQARFFVQDANTASALKDVSYKVFDEKNRKVCAKGIVYLVGHDIDIILNRRNCMTATLKIIERNFPELLSLNLRNNKLYQLDGLSDITEKAPRVNILNLSKNELKSVRELDKVKGLKLQELWLEGNPLCRTFPDRSAYVRPTSPLCPLTCSPVLLVCRVFLTSTPSLPQPALHDCAPEIRVPPPHQHCGCSAVSQMLEPCTGKGSSSPGPHAETELPPPNIGDVEIPELIKPCMESYKGSEMLKNLVLQFLQQYFLIYDSGDRQGLLGAYHDEACFSLTIPFNPENPGPSSLCEYFKESRNMKKLKDPYLRRKLLKHTKHDIVNTLSLLPKTQHDLSSFLVDMWFHTEMMVCFSVNGIFKEVEGNSQGDVRAFTRTFISTPASNSSLCIVNDELFVRNASSKETQSAFSIQVPTPCSSSVPSLSQEQQEMVQAFSTQSGMNLEWSQKCLQDNEWDYPRAGQVFIMLQVRNGNQVGKRLMFLDLQEGQ